MKFLAVFAALVAVACAKTWTLPQLSEAIHSPITDATLKPYLETALNEMMDALWSGHQIEAVTVTIPSVDQTSMTLAELSEALANLETDPALIPNLEAALNQLMDDLFSGKPVESATVAAPAMEIQYYSLHELSEAIQNPETNAALLPYLEHALNELMTAIFAEQQVSAITIAVPAGLTPVVPEVIPGPAEDLAPEMPTIPALPSLPEAPASPAAPASPLVQIIINVNQQGAAPIEIPVDPVNIVDMEPVSPVDVIDVAPIVDPVQVVDEASVVEPVEVVDVSPVEVIDVMPVVVTPVEVVDVAPIPVEVVDTAPEAAEPVVVATPSVIKH